MNLVKLQDDLKNLPDSMLVKYIENPTPMAPSYLVLSELERRKRMRQSAQPAEAPKQSIAEAAVQEAQQGLAMVPPPMGRPTQQYSSGGIVAFQGGGYISNMIDRMLLPYPDARAEDGVPRRGIAAYSPQAEEALGETVPYKGPVVIPASQPTTVKQPSPAGLRAATPPVGVVPPVGVQKLQPTAPRAPMPPAQTPQAAAVAPDYNVSYAPPPEIAESAFMPTTPAKTAEDEAARFRKLLGENESVAQSRARLEKMDESAAKDKRELVANTLIDFGLSMAAGTSQNFLQNVAQGAQAAAVKYQERKDKALAAEERRFALAQQIAQAERAEQLAISQFGENSAQADRAMRETARLKGLDVRAAQALNTANKNFEAAKANAEIKLDITKLKSQEAIANRELGVRQTIAERQAKATERYGMQAQQQALTISLKEVNDQITEASKIGSPTQKDLPKLQREAAEIKAQLRQFTGLPPSAAVIAPVEFSNPGWKSVK